MGKDCAQISLPMYQYIGAKVDFLYIGNTGQYLKLSYKIKIISSVNDLKINCLMLSTHISIDQTRLAIFIHFSFHSNS